MSKDIKWVGGRYATDGLTYSSLEEVIGQLHKALEAQKRGEWRSLSLDIVEDYGSHSIILIGQRPETDAERTKREDLTKRQEEYRRETYEKLKKEFEGK